MAENYIPLPNEDEVQERIKYERVLAEAFAAFENTKVKAFVAMNSIKFKQLKTVFGQKNEIRIDFGIAALHIFCPPFALAVDAALAGMGISGSAAAITVPVVAGVVGVSMGIGGGLLYKNRYEFPKGSKKIKEAIQQRNSQGARNSGENLENVQNTPEQTQGKESILNRIEDAQERSEANAGTKEGPSNNVLEENSI